MEAIVPKILLVDDDPAFTQLYSAVFQANGLDFAIAKNGSEALQMTAAERYGLILLDIMLPGINGMGLLKKLKADPQTADIPVWMITNLAEQLNKEMATSLGAEDYLVKASFTPKQVVEKIKTLFSNAASTPTNNNQNPPNSPQ